MRPSSWALIAVCCAGCRNQGGQLSYTASVNAQPVKGTDAELTASRATLLKQTREAQWRIVRASGLGSRVSDGVVSPLAALLGFDVVRNGISVPEQNELAAMLGFNPEDSEDDNLAVAALLTSLETEAGRPVAMGNAMWMLLPAPVRREFAQGIGASHRARVGYLGSYGLTAVREVNDWIRLQTGDRIAPLKELDRDCTVLVTSLCDVDPSRFLTVVSQAGIFAARQCLGAVVLGSVGQASRDGIDVYRLPVRNPSFRVSAIVPREGSTRGALMAMLRPGGWDSLKFTSAGSKQRLWIPTFAMETDFELSPECLADDATRRLAGSDMLRVSHECKAGQYTLKCRQRSKIAFGSRASEGSDADQVDLAIERPFLFVIEHEETGAIIAVASVSSVSSGRPEAPPQ